MALGLAYLSQLEVERLDGVGRVNQPSQVRREVEERPHALPVAPPRGRDRRKALGVLGFKRFERREARLLGGCRVDVAQLGADRLVLDPADEAAWSYESCARCKLPVHGRGRGKTMITDANRQKIDLWIVGAPELRRIECTETRRRVLLRANGPLWLGAHGFYARTRPAGRCRSGVGVSCDRRRRDRLGGARFRC